MKYKVVTNELEWHTVVYFVEADSEEEIENMSHSDLIEYYDNEDYDCLDQWSIESIEPLDDEDE
jgi:hypothetical protein